MRERWVLPSGAVCTLGGSPLDPVPGIFREELSGVRAELRAATGGPLRIGELPLEDFHTLRALLRRAEAIPEAEIRVVCENCHESFGVVPCATLELAPYRDDELNDDELDARFAFDETLPVDGLGEVKFARRTVAEAQNAFEELMGGEALSPRGVHALGVVQLGAAVAPEAIAAELTTAEGPTLDALAVAYEIAHYPPRLCAPHRCPHCTATTWLPVPRERELGVLEPPTVPGTDDFMSFDAFEALVGSEAVNAYRNLGVSGVALEVVDGPADCDDGGDALLGSYQPHDPDGLPPDDARIRVFYRTFANQYAAEPYSVREEVSLTLRHELEHHLAFLAGHDAVDDDERAAIDDELARRVGKTEVQRRAARELSQELRAFFARTWFIWVLAALGAAATAFSER